MITDADYAGLVKTSRLGGQKVVGRQKVAMELAAGRTITIFPQNTPVNPLLANTLPDAMPEIVRLSIPDKMARIFNVTLAPEKVNASQYEGIAIVEFGTEGFQRQVEFNFRNSVSLNVPGSYISVKAGYIGLTNGVVPVAIAAGVRTGAFIVPGYGGQGLSRLYRSFLTNVIASPGTFGTTLNFFNGREGIPQYAKGVKFITDQPWQDNFDIEFRPSGGGMYYNHRVNAGGPMVDFLPITEIVSQIIIRNQGPNPITQGMLIFDIAP